MPQTCSVCKHAERAAIDAALVGGESLRNIAEQYSVSTTALHRHKTDHIPANMAQAKEAASLAHADSLLDQVKALQVSTLALMTKAEGAGDLRTAVSAIREAARLIELTARLTNELPSQPIINILLTDDWLKLRSAILAAIDPYPDAFEAVTRAISR